MRATGDRRRSRTRDALLNGLDGELRRVPIERISTAVIASAAGVSVGSLYVHFEGKRRLFLSLPLERVRDEAVSLAIAQFTESPAERVIALGDLLMLAGERTPAAPELLRQFPDGYAELMRSNDPLAGVASCLHRALTNLDADLEQMQREGTLRLDADSGDATLALTAMWRGLLELGASTDGRSAASRLRDTWSSMAHAVLQPL